jgi:hypothetical protein
MNAASARPFHGRGAVDGIRSLAGIDPLASHNVAENSGASREWAGNSMASPQTTNGAHRGREHAARSPDGMRLSR